MHKTVLILTIIFCYLNISKLSFAHGVHAPQAPGIIDPLITHHAVLEDELKLNYFASPSQNSLLSQGVSLELAYAFTDLLGIEVFLPVQFVSSSSTFLTGSLNSIEVQIPKISFLRNYNLVMTSYIATELPVDGTSPWVTAPHLLIDYGFGNFGLQNNLAIEWESDGHTALEGNFSLAYAIPLTKTDNQQFAPLIEFNIELPLSEPESFTGLITPGLKYSWGGWHIGTGIQIPITRNREFDYQFLFQLGYHIQWNQFMFKTPEP